eukprot:CAMPEP_0114112320 /NCGR_PEP_ID=MMETSP0043_2-20121206/2326_1 /TAXON_ID=464988 /ORGANISM="Hemiselmis andersenii, Strain CCMP644" /LENGTH=751 /DNA_ID=CAMNT_0001204415 /DNA_START=61 /DNA_END=2316 /DNA_ORIENTATION=-
MKLRFLAGEVPEPHTLVVAYVLASLFLELGRAQDTDHQPFVHGSQTAIFKVLAVWAGCFTMSRARMFEPKVISNRLIMQLAASYAFSVCLSEVVSTAQAGNEVANLFIPATSLITAAIQQRFFHTSTSDEGGQLHLGGMCVCLTAAQLMVLRSRGDIKADQGYVIPLCLTKHAVAVFFVFTLWLRARQSRLSPVQALQRSSSMALPCLICFFLLSKASMPLSHSPPIPPAASARGSFDLNTSSVVAPKRLPANITTHHGVLDVPGPGGSIKTQVKHGGVVHAGAIPGGSAKRMLLEGFSGGNAVAENGGEWQKQNLLSVESGLGKEGGRENVHRFENKIADGRSVGGEATGNASGSTPLAFGTTFGDERSVKAERVLGAKLFEMIVWSAWGALVDLLTFVMIIYGGPTLVQVAGCTRLCVWVVVTVIKAPEGMTATSHAVGMVGALAGAAMLLQYMKRWQHGWGSMPVPVLTLHMGAISDFEHSIGRQIGNEMTKIGGDIKKTSNVEVSQELFSPTQAPKPAELSGVTPTGGLEMALKHQLESGNPPMFNGGVLLTDEEKTMIWSWLPYRHQVKTAQLIYSGEQHGYSLHSLYRMSEQAVRPRELKRGHETPCVLIIKTSHKEVLGCFTSTHWHRQDHYYGNGECFVFRLRTRPQRFRWSKVNDMMMLGGARSLSIGSGSEPAIWLDDELSYGMTAKCDTFSNPPLVTCEGAQAMPPKDGDTSDKYNKMHAPGRTQAVFRCVAVELYMLES